MKKENHKRSLCESINQDVYTESKNLVCRHRASRTMKTKCVIRSFHLLGSIGRLLWNTDELSPQSHVLKPGSLAGSSTQRLLDPKDCNFINESTQ